MISDQGVATNSNETQSMLNWLVPMNITKLRGFLGLIGYYRKFVQGYGIIAKPLTKLVQNTTEEAQAAFNALKHAMVTPPIPD